MPDIFHETTVAKSRKDRVCSWCGSEIEIGKPYRGYSWRDGGDFSREEMHPECYDAMCEEATAEGAFIAWSEKRGLQCRKCGCRHFWVIYTRSAWGGKVIRRRECRHCGERLTTWERAIGSG